MYIKIYFDEKAIYLCDVIDEEINEILHHPDAIFIDEVSNAAIKSLLHEIVKEEFHAGVLFHADLKKLKETFFKQFTQIEAAGGIVQNESKELLFIFRLGKWDLPKGKIEKGEKPETAAVREVEEETNVTNITLKHKVGQTHHTYNAYGKHYIKTTYWYYMVCAGKQNTKPQIEEDISEIKWINTENIKQPMANTYPSIKDVLNTFFDKP